MIYWQGVIGEFLSVVYTFPSFSYPRIASSAKAAIFIFCKVNAQPPTHEVAPGTHGAFMQVTVIGITEEPNSQTFWLPLQRLIYRLAQGMAVNNGLKS